MTRKRSIGAVMANMTARCTSCGDCVRPCAFLQQQGTPATIAGRGALPDNLLTAYGCSLCGLCDSLCPEGLTPSGLFREMRQEAADQGLVDLKPYKPWLTYERLGGSVLFRRDHIPANCRTVFFPGCSLPGTRPAATKELFRRLQHHDRSIGLVLDCCGKISHDLGLQKQFNTIFNRLQHRLKTYGITRVLTACPGCSKILKKHGQDIEVYSVYELLAEQPTSVPEMTLGTVSVHDPCPARFDLAQHKAVRNLIERTGYRIKGLPSSGSLTRCCGQGGMVEGCVPGTVRREASLISAEAAGRPLVSSCAGCCETLSSVTPTAHVADLLTGTGSFSDKPAASLRRWFNRLLLRFSRLP